MSGSTVTLQVLKTTLWELIGELYQSVVTTGGTVSIGDNSLIGYTSETWPAKVVGSQIYVTSGTCKGNLRMAGRFSQATGLIYPNYSFSSSGPAINDFYELWGSAINGGSPLTNLFNAVVRDLRPVTDTQITIVTNQAMYDVSTLVQSRRDIHQVYIRELDPAGIVPYRVHNLAPGLDWYAYDRGGGSTESVTLELTNPLTLNTTTTQLWLRGETLFTPFATDASTVEADYQDWLAWEAILELSRRKLSLGTMDVARWTALEARAIEELTSDRTRWLAGHEPIPISTWP